MSSIEQALDELMWPSVKLDPKLSMSDRHDIYEWCYDTFGVADFWMEKNRLYFKREQYITLFRIRCSWAQ